MSMTLAKLPDGAQKFVHMEVLRISYSKNFRSSICSNISHWFPNLRILQLNSCPIGMSDCSLLGNKYLPNLVELDMSGDSYVSKESLEVLSKGLPKLEIFHLGHFEHSDYNCSQTVMKKSEQRPLRGLFIIEIFKDCKRFQSLKKLFLEDACDLTNFICHEMKT